MSARDKFKVGHIVWCLPTDRRVEPFHAVIEKVGRKYVTLAGYRCSGARLNTETMMVGTPGFSPDARAFLSEEERTAYMERGRAWGLLRRTLAEIGTPPPGLTTGEIKAFTERLAK